MHYGIQVATLGEYADARVVVELARTAEAAGWEGLFVWDHLGFVWGAPSGDPWVILAAVATATTRLALGTAVAPLPRYRPAVLAQTLTTLDRLSGGRLIFGAGLGGVPGEFAAFGEPDDPRQRAAMLDEGLALLDRLWSGEPVTHRGAHYTVTDVTLAPLPVQRPRIPVWVGGASRPALRRAAHWDGWLASAASPDGTMTLAPDELAAMVATIRRHRTSAAPFAVVLDGYSTAAEGALTREYAAAGATWWLESIHGLRGPRADLLARVAAGPPA